MTAEIIALWGSQPPKLKGPIVSAKAWNQTLRAPSAVSQVHMSWICRHLPGSGHTTPAILGLRWCNNKKHMIAKSEYPYLEAVYREYLSSGHLCNHQQSFKSRGEVRYSLATIPVNLIPSTILRSARFRLISTAGGILLKLLPVQEVNLDKLLPSEYQNRFVWLFLFSFFGGTSTIEDWDWDWDCSPHQRLM